MIDVKLAKKAYVIVNLKSGTGQSGKYFAGIIENLQRGGYECTVGITMKAEDGIRLAKRVKKGDYDLIVAIGGDGTYNEVVAGILDTGVSIPIGYIPSGSTNDFADTIGLSGDMLMAAWDVTTGKAIEMDVGQFNNRYFSYVASFGAFTGVSYNTPQTMKNAFGHFAYVLNSIPELANIQPWHVKVETEHHILEGDYIFGAICNTTSVAGILTIEEELVDLSDGKFELLMVKYPANPIELHSIIRALTRQNYNSPYIDFFSAREINIEASSRMDWTLDGEFQAGAECIHIKNIHNAVKVIIPTGGEFLNDF